MFACFFCLPQCASTLQTNTFQGVIISNSVQSYYVFSYTCGAIQWSGLGDETAVVGFNFNADYFDNHIANSLPDIGHIMSCTRQSIIPGFVQSRQLSPGMIGGSSGRIPILETLALCDTFANADDASIASIDQLRDVNGSDIASKLPSCPPQAHNIMITPHNFSLFSTQSTGNCYRSNKTFVPIGSELQGNYKFVSVCCYSHYG